MCGCDAPKGHDPIAQGEAKRSPGFGATKESSPEGARLANKHGDCALSGLDSRAGLIPRPLAWATGFRTFGAASRKPCFPAVWGSMMVAGRGNVGPSGAMVRPLFGMTMQFAHRREVMVMNSGLNESASAMNPAPPRGDSSNFRDRVFEVLRKYKD